MINGPTVLTIARMILAIIFAIFASLPDFWSRIVALVVFIIAAITDQIDGYWARKRKIVTNLGAFLDPLADKMLVNLAFLILVASNTIPLWVFATILVRDFAVDGMRMMAAKNKVTISASMLGKAKTVTQMIAIIIILLSLILDQACLKIVGDVILYIALALTVISGVDYLKKGWKLAIKQS